MGELNKKLSEKKSVIRDFINEINLFPPEVFIFFNHLERPNRLCILDMGIGLGRTTWYLKEFFHEYHGIDYSAQMVELSRKRFPELDIRLCDARDLSPFEAESMDFVLFSFNGLDTVDHEGRMLVLTETARVLKSKGLFVFSSHNRGKYPQAILPELEVSLIPYRMVKRTGCFFNILGSLLSSQARSPFREGLYDDPGQGA